MLLYVWFIAGEKRGKYSCELWSVIALIFMDSLWTCCVCGLSKCKEIFSRKIDILFLVTFIHFIPWFFRQNFQKTVHGFVCSYLSFFIPLAQLHEYFIYNKQSVHSSHLRSSLLFSSHLRNTKVVFFMRPLGVGSYQVLKSNILNMPSKLCAVIVWDVIV